METLFTIWIALLHLAAIVLVFLLWKANKIIKRYENHFRNNRGPSILGLAACIILPIVIAKIYEKNPQ